MATRTLVMTGFLLACAAGGTAVTHAASEPEGAADPAGGKVIFLKLCAGCHGPGGKGDGYRLLGADPANLTSAGTKNKPDAELLATIHSGKGTMPSWNGRLSPQESRQVLAYIRSLPK